jgi:hypothetical protein
MAKFRVEAQEDSDAPYEGTPEKETWHSFKDRYSTNNISRLRESWEEHRKANQPLIMIDREGWIWKIGPTADGTAVRAIHLIPTYHEGESEVFQQENLEDSWWEADYWMTRGGARAIESLTAAQLNLDPGLLTPTAALNTIPATDPIWFKIVKNLIGSLTATNPYTEDV